jgi:hypothetical protein
MTDAVRWLVDPRRRLDESWAAHQADRIASGSGNLRASS